MLLESKGLIAKQVAVNPIPTEQAAPSDKKDK
jgi:hypothetical protein